MYYNTNMDIYRYKITLGEVDVYDSFLWEMSRAQFVEKFKNMYFNTAGGRRGEPISLGVDLRDPNLSKEVRRFSNRTFITDFPNSRVFDLSKFKCSLHGFYEGYQEKERVFNYFNNIPEGQRFFDINELIDDVGVERDEFFSRLGQLVKAGYIRYLYSIDGENWTEELQQFSPRPLNEIFVCLEKIGD